ncbi:MAG: ATP-binding cassette domain-containing protein, partial [Planctomycetes bacterium]|nr:ATP-binding cassette domain-containing protein [Planctomycetota bacterium]
MTGASGTDVATRTVLSLRGITKTYGTEQNPVPVLRGIDLQVTEGEYVAIVGASGSGKSTMLNILGCLDRPTSGSYHLVGEDVAKLDDLSLSRVRKTHIGFVFQSFQLVSHLSVQENVELPLLYARVPRTERRRRAGELIERVGLGHRRGHLPTMLSGGECQR